MKSMTIYQVRIAKRTFRGWGETLDRAKAEATLQEGLSRYNRNGRELSVDSHEREIFEPGDKVFYQRNGQQWLGEVKAIVEGDMALTLEVLAQDGSVLNCPSSPMNTMVPGCGREILRLADEQEVIV